MSFLLRLLLLCLAAVSLNAADSESPVELSSTAGLRSGTLLREKREVRVQEGKARMEPSNPDSGFSCRFMQKVNLVRRLLGSDSEEVQVREMVCELVNYSGVPPPPSEQAAPLVGKTLRMRKTGGSWKATLTDGKASAEEQKFMADLAFTRLLLEIPEACLLNQTRKAGEAWKVGINESAGKAYGAVVARDIECTLVSVNEQPGGPLATVHLAGSFSMQRPMGYLSEIEVTFDATLVRRLSDMLDLDTRISGQLKLVGIVKDKTGKPVRLIQEMPYTLTRSMALERKQAP